ncbi:MAG TPA: hypothetical protein VJM33_11605 [Microthrixaceae bacterium]|nr:hypothetical protein [Microthrixaceae bacterium]
MLFEQRFWSAIADGSVTVTFRRWKRPQVTAGRRYRTAAGIIEVTSFDEIDPSVIDDGDARRAGMDDAATVRAELRGAADLPTYRIEFHLVDEPDPRAVLAADDALVEGDVVEITRRLDRLDHSSRHGPWTRATLEVIRAHPGRRAADLAAELDREREPFKVDVRKLKELGLTESLEVGYRLSPRGTAYLATTSAATDS